jgi:hypothetical protein
VVGGQGYSSDIQTNRIDARVSIIIEQPQRAYVAIQRLIEGVGEYEQAKEGYKSNLL